MLTKIKTSKSGSSAVTQRDKDLLEEAIDSSKALERARRAFDAASRANAIAVKKLPARLLREYVEATTPGL